MGLILLTTFVIMGRGLGASGGFTSIVAFGVDSVAPTHAESNQVFSTFLENEGKHPLNTWLVYEIIGIFIGGFLAALFAGRIKGGTDKGPNISKITRLSYAFTGGLLMGFAAKIARGCTSGQALTGGAILSLGSWIFMLALFAGGFIAATFVRRQWL